MPVMRLVALALLVTGCGGGPECGATADGDGNMCNERLTATLRVSSDFSGATWDALLLGAESWSELTGDRARVRLSYSSATDLHELDVYPFDMPDGKAASQHSEYGVIQIAPWLPAEQTATAFAHELGHYFGMSHVGDAEQCMHHVADSLPGAGDLQHFNRLYAERR